MKKNNTRMKSALLLIDLQNDFFPGGALGVSQGEQVIPIANQAIASCLRRNELIIASQDWHPINHRSFAINSNKEVGTSGELDGLPQIWWPIHCVQESKGAALHHSLHQQHISALFRKGEDPNIDSYSAFFDNGHRSQTHLDDWLTSHGITHLTVMGLATDYCVKFSVLDALRLGYQTSVLIDGCRGVNLKPTDSDHALSEMQEAGGQLISLSQFLSR